MTILQASTLKRESGIELLKIFAILLIITSHVVQTLASEPSFLPVNDYVVKIEEVTTDPKMLILSMLRYSGAFGNTIFFICSAWFLIGRKRNEKPKALQMLADNWMVSILILVLFLGIDGRINGSLALRAAFPFYFSNNWYINCYIAFLLLYPLLNILIERLDQRTHSRIVFFLMLWVFLLPFSGKPFKFLFGACPNIYCGDLGNWCAIYIIIAYLKRYRQKRMNSTGFSLTLVLVGFFGTYGLVLASNFLGLRFSVFKESLIMWNDGTAHPFLILMVIGLLNLARKMKTKNALVNYISGLSFFIYIVHDNILVRSLLRPAMWQYVYEKYGYGHILTLVFAQVAFVFVASLVVSILYYHSFHKLIVRICKQLYPRIEGIFCRLENRRFFDEDGMNFEE